MLPCDWILFFSCLKILLVTTWLGAKSNGFDTKQIWAKSTPVYREPILVECIYNFTITKCGWEKKESLTKDMTRLVSKWKLNGCSSPISLHWHQLLLLLWPQKQSIFFVVRNLSSRHFQKENKVSNNKCKKCRIGNFNTQSIHMRERALPNKISCIQGRIFTWQSINI